MNGKPTCCTHGFAVLPSSQRSPCAERGGRRSARTPSQAATARHPPHAAAPPPPRAAQRGVAAAAGNRLLAPCPARLAAAWLLPRGWSAAQAGLGAAQATALLEPRFQGSSCGWGDWEAAQKVVCSRSRGLRRELGHSAGTASSAGASAPPAAPVRWQRFHGTQHGSQPDTSTRPTAPGPCSVASSPEQRMLPRHAVCLNRWRSGGCCNPSAFKAACQDGLLELL